MPPDSDEVDDVEGHDDEIEIVGPTVTCNGCEDEKAQPTEGYEQCLIYFGSALAYFKGMVLRVSASVSMSRMLLTLRTPTLKRPMAEAGRSISLGGSATAVT